MQSYQKIKKKNSENTAEPSTQNATKVNFKPVNRESPEKPKLFEQAAISESVHEDNDEEMQVECSTSVQEHPLTCDDVSFQFNTMQLKSIKTINAFKKTDLK